MHGSITFSLGLSTCSGHVGQIDGGFLKEACLPVWYQVNKKNLVQKYAPQDVHFLATVGQIGQILKVGAPSTLNKYGTTKDEVV